MPPPDEMPRPGRALAVLVLLAAAAVYATVLGGWCREIVYVMTGGR